MAKESPDHDLSLKELSDRCGQKSAKGRQAISLLSGISQASMTQPLISHTEGLPMLTLTHRWMKNRNLVSGVTVVSFNGEGVAKVQNMGNAILDCQSLCRRYPTLIEMTLPGDAVEVHSDVTAQLALAQLALAQAAKEQVFGSERVPAPPVRTPPMPKVAVAPVAPVVAPESLKVPVEPEEVLEAPASAEEPKEDKKPVEEPERVSVRPAPPKKKAPPMKKSSKRK